MDLDRWITRLTYGDILTETEVKMLCDKVKEILSKEPTLIRVSSPVVVCGDTHGQHNDVVNLFRIGGFPADTKYLFMGDYVDRGRMSVEVISLLFCYKIKHPSTFYLLRGNHESRELTKVYTFFDECFGKYNNTRVWTMFTDAFEYLPLSGVVDDRVVCMHGGLSPAGFTLDNIANVDRIKEPPKYGIMTHLLWSDPGQQQGWKDSNRKGYYAFGPNVTAQFLHVNGLEFISRAHQVQQKGYRWHHNNQCVTVFSAPYYCRMTNRAAIMRLDETKSPQFEVFGQSDF
ncbi:hypothetical protein QR680_004802 [Steinernema hermaphroditum]|uniref:Serine/threonine-protein phosphatase n=1 Tax=Steinernema hermaphroditum TaxID=289476 RepID=A0AA39LTT1_9BILA|nr:hypothetical protein QR680_004802 [Steinernema hermaphroditum]